MSNEYDDEATMIREREAGVLTDAHMVELIRAAEEAQAAAEEALAEYEEVVLRLTHGDTALEVNGDAARPVAIGIGLALAAIGIGLGVAIANGSSSDS